MLNLRTLPTASVTLRLLLRVMIDRGTTELVHTGARALLDINLIWLGYIARLSQ